MGFQDNCNQPKKRMNKTKPPLITSSCKVVKWLPVPGEYPESVEMLFAVVVVDKTFVAKPAAGCCCCCCCWRRA